MRIHLQPKQEQLYDLLAATGPDIPVLIGAGGGKGCGKSAGARNIALLQTLELGERFPGITTTITRRVEGDLIDNHVTPLFREYPEFRPYWSAGERSLRIPGRGSINFRYAQTKDDVIRKFMGGYESAINLVEEAQQFAEEELQMIHASSRWTNSQHGIPENLCKTAFLFNTGGLAGSYMRRVFHYKRFEGRENPAHFHFVIWYGWDNYEWFRSLGRFEESDFYALPSMCGLGTESLGNGDCCRFHIFVRDTTEGRKYNAYPPSIRQGYLLANFDHFEGQYFAGVWDNALCTITPGQAERLIQPWWRRWMSMDWGFAHHTSVKWAAAGKITPDKAREILNVRTNESIDVIIVYRELVVNRTAEFDLANRIVDLTPPAERAEIRRWYVGHDCFSKDRHAEHTVSELMEAVTKPAGLPVMERATVDRVPGWRTLHDCWRRTGALRRGQDPGPGPILLISQACPATISAVPVLISDPTRMEDVLKLETVEDDIADDLRYLVESWLKAKTQAPVDVRAREVYDSYSDETYRALKMKQFAEQERTKTLPGRRFR